MKMTQTAIIDSVARLTEGTHELTFKEGRLKGKKLIHHPSWASFEIVFLMKNDAISVRARGVSKRFDPSDAKEINEILVGFEII